MGARLEAKAIQVSRASKAIVRGVDLRVDEGEVVGVLGPSGAGKSTLFRALAGDDEDARGVVLLDGEDVSRLALWERARRGLGYIPQTPSVLWDLTVRANLDTFHRIALGASPDPRDLDAAATRVELTARLDVRAGDLSAGERRRLELARAITRPPRVLICDEPFAGVDPRGAAHLGDLLRDLAKTGVAVVLADHHVEEALRICTRAVLLLDGAIRVDATPEAFREDKLVRGRYLGTIEAP